MPSVYVEILGNAKQFKKELDGAVASTAKANSGFAKMSKAAGIAGVALAGGLAYGLAKSVEAASKFQGSMELIQTQAGASTKEVRNMSKALLAMAGDVGSTPEELSKGLYHVESAGFRGAKALSILKLAAEGAAVGHSDLEATTTALVAAQRSGIKGLGDMSHAMGSLNAIVGAGNMRMDDLTAALGTGILPVAKAFGLSIADVGAALATMTSNGIPAVNAASGLKMMMSSLAAPTVAAKGALKSIGLSSTELADTMRNKGLNAALVELKGHLTGSGLNATQTAALLTTAFGKKSSTPLLTLIGNLGSMKKAQEQVKTGASEFGKNWQETQKSNEFATKKFHATMSALAVGLGASLLPAVTSVAGELAHMAGFLVEHQTLAKALVIGLGALATVLIGLSVAEALYSAATKIATAAQWLFNAAMDANPIGLLVIGIAALVAAMVILYTRSSTVRAIVQGAFAGIKQAGEAAFGFLTNTVFPAFQNAWNKSGGVVGAVVGAIKGYIGGVKTEVMGVVNFVGDLLHGRWGKLWGDAVQIVRGIVQQLKAIFLDIPKAILSHLGDIAGAAQSLGSAILNGIVGAVKGLPGALTSVVSAGLSALRSLIESFHVTVKTKSYLGVPVPVGMSMGFNAVGFAESLGLVDSSGGVGVDTDPGGFGSKITGGLGPPPSAPSGSRAFPHGTFTKPGAGARGSVSVPSSLGGGGGSGSDAASKAADALKAKLQAVADAAEKVRAVVQEKMDTAFGRIKDYALKAFDGATQAGLKKLQDHATAVSQKIASDLNATLATLNAANAAPTASEAALAALQAQHAQQGLTDASNSAASDLAAAMAGGDPAAIAAAQKAVDDAAYNQRVADLTAAAATERAAANDKLAIDTKAAQDAAAVKQAAADKQATADQLNFNASRDLKKNALQTQLDDLQAHLDQHPKLWKKTHKQIMDMFDKDFGPDFTTAGVNIGTAYIKGLKQAFADVDPIASAAATATGKANKAAGKVPRMALGGIVKASPGGTHVILGEGGRDEMVVPLGGGSASVGGGGNVYVTVQGWVGNDQDIAERIRNTLIRTGRNTTGGALGRFA